MKNFKEIAEQVLAGKIKGFFILRDGTAIHSNCLHRGLEGAYPYKLNDFTYTEYGNMSLYLIMKRDIIKFKKKEEEMEEKRKIEINVPENKIAIIEETSEKITITWKENELTYEDIREKLSNDRKYIGNFGYNTMSPNLNTQTFYRKMGVLHKLVNIRNYFGKPDSYDRGYCISYNSSTNKFYVGNIITVGRWTKDIIFAKKEHAEQAVKMLGDELKYLFEPW